MWSPLPFGVLAPRLDMIADAIRRQALQSPLPFGVLAPWLNATIASGEQIGKKSPLPFGVLAPWLVTIFNMKHYQSIDESPLPFGVLAPWLQAKDRKRPPRHRVSIAFRR